MAKKGRYGRDDEPEGFPPGDVAEAEARRAKDESRDDGDYAADPGVDTQDSEPAPGTSPDDGTKYTVVEAGTVINGVYFPRADAEGGQEMVVYLPDATAAELVRCGVALHNEDGSPVEAGEDPNPPAEGTDGEEGEEIPA
jgi:hypothetical protein